MIGTVSNQALSQETPPPLYKETSFQQTPIGEIPQDWEVRELDSLAEIYDSKRIPLSKMERKNKKGHYPYCGANGIIDYINDYIFDGEYILLAEDGGAYGKFENTAYLMGGKFWVNNHAHILKTIEGKASNQFLKTMLDFLDLNFYIVGSTRKKLNQERMREIKIPAPSLPEQRAIVGVLGVVDSAIEYSDRIVAKTERLKRGLMQQLLTHSIGHTEYKETPIGKTPNDWKIVKIADVSSHVGSGLTPRGGSSTYLERGIPLIRSQNVLMNKLDLSDVAYISHDTHEFMSRSVVYPGDVLLNITGASIGRVSVVPDSIKEANVNQHVCRIRFVKDVLPQFAAYYLSSPNGQNQIMSFQAGATRQGLNYQQVRAIQLPCPSIEEQKKIADILSTTDLKIDMERKERSTLDRVKQGLMDLLLTGKIRIKVD